MIEEPEASPFPPPPQPPRFPFEPLFAHGKQVRRRRTYPRDHLLSPQSRLGLQGKSVHSTVGPHPTLPLICTYADYGVQVRGGGPAYATCAWQGVFSAWQSVISAYPCQRPTTMKTASGGVLRQVRHGKCRRSLLRLWSGLPWFA
jgi:hypothetical protein